MIEAIRRRLSGQARLADADTPMPDVEGAPNEQVLLIGWRDWHRTRLLNAAAQRRERDEWVPSDFDPFGGGSEPGWLAYERRVMLVGVNAARERMGKPPIGAELVARVERHAGGHCDYVDKFALYCAELTMDRAPWASR